MGVTLDAGTARGKQTPTICIRLPYTESLGTEAAQLYNQSGRTAQDWQAHENAHGQQKGLTRERMFDKI